MSDPHAALGRSRARASVLRERDPQCCDSDAGKHHEHPDHNDDEGLQPAHGHTVATQVAAVGSARHIRSPHRAEHALRSGCERATDRYLGS